MTKVHAPAAARNREPILAVLRRLLVPAAGVDRAQPPRLVLEVASGSGEHALAFARALPGLAFQPSDPDPRARASIAAHAEDAGLANLRAPVALDVTEPGWHEPWTAEPLLAILCINMLHIAPWRAAEGLFRGAGALFGGVAGADAALVTYGPYRFAGRYTAESNAAFDADLRARDPAWGVRDTVDLERAAAEAGLALVETVPLPANNHVLVFRRAAPRRR